MSIILLLSVRRHGEHNELLTQVANRVERAQLLVYNSCIYSIDFHACTIVIYSYYSIGIIYTRSKWDAV